VNEYSELALVEQPAVALLGELGWQTTNCFCEQFGPRGTLARETKSDVVLVDRLRTALEKLNPGLDAEAIRLAIEELTRDRSVMSLAAANREVYQLLKNGVHVTVKAEDEETTETVRVIDWSEPNNNDFFLASQFWVAGRPASPRRGSGPKQNGSEGPCTAGC